MGEKNPGHQQRQQGFADAENHFRQACEIFEREAARVRKEQGSIDAMSKKLDQVISLRLLNSMSVANTLPQACRR